MLYQNKLMWNTAYKKHVWQSFKATVTKLEDLLHSNLISDVAMLDKFIGINSQIFIFFRDGRIGIDHEAYLEMRKGLEQKEIGNISS